MIRLILLVSLSLHLSACSSKLKNAQPSPVEGAYDAELTGFTYPFPVQEAEVTAQGQKFKMAYMDLKPSAPVVNSNPGVVVLLHGKNFSGFYFEAIARDLQKAGYRVFIPDQIGFGKSSKPTGFQYSFHQLAQLTEQLLEKEGIQHYILIGHSMGGMLATRMALMYPEAVQKLILVNPIGLEDYKLLTPYRSVAQLEAGELQSTPEKIKQYQVESYYDGKWKPEYEALIQPAVGWTKGADFPHLAKTAAQTAEMIYTQPVVYEFGRLKMPTVLILGQRDRTAIGKAWAPPAIQKEMGNYPRLGKAVVKTLPKGKLIELKSLGHVPFLEDPVAFQKALQQALSL